MTTIPFDTLSYTNRLMKVGFTREQAEGQAELMAETINIQLATKNDLKELKKDLLNKLTWTMGGMFIAAISILDFLLKR
jgi:hypothetical protein